jgi:phosphoribosylaminoimidazole-succinocarboxamide synthase
VAAPDVAPSPPPQPDAPRGLALVHQGKVRDLYALGEDQLVMVASDRLSAFDWILDSPVPDKGAILTQLSLWWFEQFADLVPNHLVSTTLPPGVPADWARRAVVCRRLPMVAVECVARGYLAGTGLLSYAADRTICGIGLPEGLSEGSRLPEPIFTPTTKAPLGEHDTALSPAELTALVGEEQAAELAELTLTVYRRAAAIAAERGILLADTKIELGRDADGSLVLADELLTPDSSRFWPADTWQPGHPQPSYDKQFVREWLQSPEADWDRTGTTPPPPLPEKIVDATRDRYVQAYERLTGTSWS